MSQSMFESLESRKLLASTWALASGTLTITGTSGADNIYVSTAAGNNMVVYDQGKQVGNLIPIANVKKIVVNCGAGNDYAYIGSVGNIPVTLKGGDGNDGLTNADTARGDIYGEKGNDNLTGGSAGDYLDGGVGDDGVSGATGNDTLLGGDGVDLLVGGVGNDSMDGGLGADRFRGGSGNDTVSYFTRTVPIIADITEGNGEQPDDGAAGEKDFIEADCETLIGGSAADKLTGATYPSTYSTSNGYTKNNKLVGNGGNDSLFGLDGNDTLDAGTGKDSLVGGTGTDLADYSKRSEALKLSLDGVANDGATGENDQISSDIENLSGGSGADSITGNSGNNVLHGNGGNDTINGGDGNDSIYGEGGIDKLLGGNGNDTLYARKPSNSTSADNDALDGGAGTDKAQVDSSDSKTSIESLLA